MTNTVCSFALLLMCDYNMGYQSWIMHVQSTLNEHQGASRIIQDVLRIKTILYQLKSSAQGDYQGVPRGGQGGLPFF